MAAITKLNDINELVTLVRESQYNDTRKAAIVKLDEQVLFEEIINFYSGRCGGCSPENDCFEFACSRISDPTRLEIIALADMHFSLQGDSNYIADTRNRCRALAAKTLWDSGSLENITNTEVRSQIGVLAMQLISDQGKLLKIALDYPDPRIAAAAASHITDEHILKIILSTPNHFSVKCTIAQRISDPSLKETILSKIRDIYKSYRIAIIYPGHESFKHASRDDLHPWHYQLPQQCQELDSSKVNIIIIVPSISSEFKKCYEKETSRQEIPGSTHHLYGNVFTKSYRVYSHKECWYELKLEVMFRPPIVPVETKIPLHLKIPDNRQDLLYDHLKQWLESSDFGTAIEVAGGKLPSSLIPFSDH